MSVASAPNQATGDAPQMRRLILRLRKGPEIRFVGHLDLMRVLERALRRAQLPLAYTEGFNPRTKLALASALAVGATSDWEICQIDLAEEPGPEAVSTWVDRLRDQLPPGLEVLEATLVPLVKSKKYIQAVAATYRLTVVGDAAAERLEDFLTAGAGFPEASELSWRETRPNEVLLQIKLPVGGGIRLRDVRSRLEEECPGLEVVNIHRARLWCAEEPAPTEGSSQKQE